MLIEKSDDDNDDNDDDNVNDINGKYENRAGGDDNNNDKNVGDTLMITMKIYITGNYVIIFPYVY